MMVQALLLVASCIAVTQVFGSLATRSLPSCEDLGGVCHALGCPRDFSGFVNASCPDDEVCCTSQQPKPRIESRKSCKKNLSCKKQGGKCQNSCSDNQDTLGKCSNSCSCCVRKCGTEMKCKNWGGKCIRRGTCKDKVIKGRKLCKRKKCTCCKEDPVTTVTTVTPGSPAPPANCSCGIANTASRISGGSEIDPPRKYPWLVGIMRQADTFIWFGGSIINSRYILTAASRLYNSDTCYFDPPKKLFILIGKHTLYGADDDENNTKKIHVKRIIIHPSYHCKMVRNNFALLELNKPVEFNDVIKPVCLPEDDSKTYESVMATVAGWWNSDNGEYGDMSSVPLEVDVLIFDTICYGLHYITAQELCAGDPLTGENGTCVNGDRGGPLVIQETGKYVQVGVLSWTKGCKYRSTPQVYGRVSKVLKWIKTKSASGQFCSN